MGILPVLLVIGVGVLIYRATAKPKAAEPCPSDKVLGELSTGISTGTISYRDAAKLAKGFDKAGCPAAALGVRAVALPKRKVPGAGGYIGGCWPPVGFVLPESWDIGAEPDKDEILALREGRKAGWTPPSGWRFGDELPKEYDCPPKWERVAVAVEGYATSEAPLKSEAPLNASSLGHRPIDRFLARSRGR